MIRWTADDNMIMKGLTKDHKESRQHLARVLHNGEWSVQRETLRWFAHNRRLNQNVHTGRNMSRLQRVQVLKSCTTLQFSIVTRNVAFLYFVFFFFLNFWIQKRVASWMEFFFLAKHVL